MTLTATPSRPAGASRTTSVMERVRRHVSAVEPGEPFIVGELLVLGPRTAVDQALTRLVRAGEIERVARGVYARPRVNPVLGRAVPVPTERVISAMARRTGAKVGVHGAEAARRFGLSTQMPLRPVFATTGRSRRVRVRGAEVSLVHTASKSMELAGQPAGDALAALLYLGKAEVTPQVVQRVRGRLGESEFETLRRHVTAMPSWLADRLFRAPDPVAV